MHNWFMRMWSTKPWRSYDPLDYNDIFIDDGIYLYDMLDEYDSELMLEEDDLDDQTSKVDSIELCDDKLD